ncbi:unnamed protein product [Bathycoccus prasinos]
MVSGKYPNMDSLAVAIDSSRVQIGLVFVFLSTKVRKASLCTTTAFVVLGSTNALLTCAYFFKRLLSSPMCHSATCRASLPLPIKACAVTLRTGEDEESLELSTTNISSLWNDTATLFLSGNERTDVNCFDVSRKRSRVISPASLDSIMAPAKRELRYDFSSPAEATVFNLMKLRLSVLPLPFLLLVLLASSLTPSFITGTSANMEASPPFFSKKADASIVTTEKFCFFDLEVLFNATKILSLFAPAQKTEYLPSSPTIPESFVPPTAV